ncbi:hypothetical protein O4H49_06365 [Kiloniella laminariae]|uniref:Orc1-like AAA ATPase domain-containing protein n=1 Tax=Kiloniella laminariae TaxID=454162 RepID=A0ABT4LK70_9PROT|nr:hypothetical protein [Kiloniella laminariae]MCZ4280392.1 hypothetical protein [Kiloniella laminariae]
MTTADLIKNPFEYDAAGNLDVQDLLDVFVEDHNYSRFICAPRNVFLIGERGSGKSMTLRFNEFRSRNANDRRHNQQINCDYVGVLVECKTPLYARRDDSFEGADELKSQLISEHLLVTEIGQALAISLSSCQSKISREENKNILTSLELFFDTQLTKQTDKLFEAIRLHFKKLNLNAQRDMNTFQWDKDDREYVTFSSAILPLLEELRSVDFFKNSHFMIMIDDAQNLNSYQQRILNSWISYRNQTVFSFKIGCAKSEYTDYSTMSSAPILEGHDYIVLDMEQPFQNRTSDFGQFAREVVSKRLAKVGLNNENNSLIENFFPESIPVKSAIQACTEKIIEEFKTKNPKATEKQARDWGYKYGRVAYFRNRSAKAGLPVYSGFDTISHLSSGVVRSLLKPCYYMYDAARSKNSGQPVHSIPSDIQSEILKNESDKLWSQVKDLHRTVTDCTEEDAAAIYNLLDNLGNYFSERLMNHKSEPRILAFVISGRNETDMNLLEPLIKICRSAGLIYVRRGVSRDKGKREEFYTPNRMLWPTKGLDPIGQHGRASIPAKDLVAATYGKNIPLTIQNQSESNQQEFELFQTPELFTGEET